jgi:hypothetical protein
MKGIDTILNFSTLSLYVIVVLHILGLVLFIFDK